MGTFKGPFTSFSSPSIQDICTVPAHPAAGDTGSPAMKDRSCFAPSPQGVPLYPAYGGTGTGWGSQGTFCQMREERSAGFNETRYGRKKAGVPVSFSGSSFLCHGILPSFLFDDAASGRSVYPGTPVRFQSFSKSAGVPNPFSSHIGIVDPWSLPLPSHTFHPLTKVFLSGSPPGIVSNLKQPRSERVASQGNITQ